MCVGVVLLELLGFDAAQVVYGAVGHQDLLSHEGGDDRAGVYDDVGDHPIDIGAPFLEIVWILVVLPGDVLGEVLEPERGGRDQVLGLGKTLQLTLGHHMLGHHLGGLYRKGGVPRRGRILQLDFNRVVVEGPGTLVVRLP